MMFRALLIAAPFIVFGGLFVIGLCRAAARGDREIGSGVIEPEDCL